MASASPQKPRPRKMVGAVQAKRHSLRQEGDSNDTPAVIYPRHRNYPSRELNPDRGKDPFVSQIPFSMLFGCSGSPYL